MTTPWDSPDADPAEDVLSETPEVTGQPQQVSSAGHAEWDVQDRVLQVTRRGAILCGPLPPTQEDLDAVEAFLDYLRASKAAEDQAGT